MAHSDAAPRPSFTQHGFCIEHAEHAVFGPANTPPYWLTHRSGVVPPLAHAVPTQHTPDTS
jgi:hypothetical protein